MRPYGPLTTGTSLSGRISALMEGSQERTKWIALAAFALLAAGVVAAILISRGGGGGDDTTAKARQAARFRPRTSRGPKPASAATYDPTTP